MIVYDLVENSINNKLNSTFVGKTITFYNDITGKETTIECAGIYLHNNEDYFWLDIYDTEHNLYQMYNSNLNFQIWNT